MTLTKQERFSDAGIKILQVLLERIEMARVQGDVTLSHDDNCRRVGALQAYKSLAAIFNEPIITQ